MKSFNPVLSMDATVDVPVAIDRSAGEMNALEATKA